MKKVIFFFLLLSGIFFIYGADEPCDFKTVSITVGAGVRNFSESSFKDVYEDTPLVYSVDIAVRALRPLEIFLHSDYLKIDGKTTYTQEKVTLTIIPVELGGRFLLSSKKSCQPKLLPYLGAGVGYYMIKEEFEAGSPIENVDEKRVGFFGEGGLRFYFGKSIFIDAKLKYISLTSEAESVKMGGIAYMGGLGFSF